jgi:hypothetical protein
VQEKHFDRKLQCYIKELLKKRLRLNDPVDIEIWQHQYKLANLNSIARAIICAVNDGSAIEFAISKLIQ